MVSRRVVFCSSIVATAVSCYTLGVIQSRHADAQARAVYDAKLEAIRAEVHTELGRKARASAVVPAATSGRTVARPAEGAAELTPSATARARMVAEIKEQLQ